MIILRDERWKDNASDIIIAISFHQLDPKTGISVSGHNDGFYLHIGTYLQQVKVTHEAFQQQFQKWKWLHETNTGELLDGWKSYRVRRRALSELSINDISLDGTLGDCNIDGVYNPAVDRILDG
jgi:hypothetical protein